MAGACLRQVRKSLVDVLNIIHRQYECFRYCCGDVAFGMLRSPLLQVVCQMRLAAETCTFDLTDCNQQIYMCDPEGGGCLHRHVWDLCLLACDSTCMFLDHDAHPLAARGITQVSLAPFRIQ